MDEARRERIKTIFDKHATPDRRMALLGEIRSRDVAQNDTLTTIELLEWLLHNMFSIHQIVAFTPDRKTAVRFEIGIASGEKKNVPYLAQDTYPGHFLAHKSNDKIISYGKRVLMVPGDIAWRVLLQLEIQLPFPRLVPWMPPPRENPVIIDLRQIFEKYMTSSILLKDRKIFDILKEQFPAEQWIVGGIYKIPESPREAQQMEEEWESAQAFDPNPMNLFGMLKKMQSMMRGAAEHTGHEGYRKESEKLDNIVNEIDSSNALSSLEIQILHDPIEAEESIHAYLECDPRQDQLWLMLGSLLAVQFHWEDALRAFTKAKDLDTTEPFCKDCIGITMDALGGEPYQGKWEIRELTDSPFKKIDFSKIGDMDEDMENELENYHRRESFQRTLKALALHHYRINPNNGEAKFEKMLSKCSVEGKISFYNSLAWKLYSQRTADPHLLDIGKSLAAKGVALAKKNNSKLLVNCLDSQACLASLLGEYKESKRLFEEALNVNQGGQENITWAEFARVLKALGDNVNYKKYKEFF